MKNKKGFTLIESNGNIRNVSLGCNTAASSISFSITK